VIPVIKRTMALLKRMTKNIDFRNHVDDIFQLLPICTVDFLMPKTILKKLLERKRRMNPKRNVAKTLMSSERV